MPPKRASVELEDPVTVGAEAESGKRGRGRPRVHPPKPKAETKGKRGRPPKRKASDEEDNAVASGDAPTSENEENTTNVVSDEPKRGRGRPPKKKPANAAEDLKKKEEGEGDGVIKRRGRPPKNKPAPGGDDVPPHSKDKKPDDDDSAAGGGGGDGASTGGGSGKSSTTASNGSGNRRGQRNGANGTGPSDAKEQITGDGIEETRDMKVNAKNYLSSTSDLHHIDIKSIVQYDNRSDKTQINLGMLIPKFNASSSLSDISRYNEICNQKNLKLSESEDQSLKSRKKEISIIPLTWADCPVTDW